LYINHKHYSIVRCALKQHFKEMSNVWTRLIDRCTDEWF